MDKIEKIKEILKKYNIRYEIYNHVAIRNCAEGKENCNFEDIHIVKTLAYKVDDKKYLFALNINEKIDYKKICSSLKISRSKLKSLDVYELNELGFEIGGVTIIVDDLNTSVYVDKKIMELDYIYCGMAEPSCTLKINVSELKKLRNIYFLDVIK